MTGYERQVLGIAIQEIKRIIRAHRQARDFYSARCAVYALRKLYESIEVEERIDQYRAQGMTKLQARNHFISQILRGDIF